MAKTKGRNGKDKRKKWQRQKEEIGKTKGRNRKDKRKKWQRQKEEMAKTKGRNGKDSSADTVSDLPQT